MSRHKTDHAAWIALAGTTVAAGAAAAVLLALRSSQSPAVAPSAPRLQPALPPAESQPGTFTPIVWAGGATRANVDALRFMFASENPDASFLVWALQALAANNWTRILARKHPRILSVSGMLQAGLKKAEKRWLYELGWGPQFDRKRGITRWASTTAGLRPDSVRWHFAEFAERLLNNRIDLPALRGRNGEKMPPEHDWPLITSYLQHERFAETVRAQAGPGAETDPEKVVASWGSPRLIADVEGVRFYGL